MSYFVVKELEVKRPVEGVEMRIISGKKMTMVFYNIEPGAEIPEHSHPHEQVGTVLGGSIELIIDKDKRIVNQGDAYHVPSNVVHSGRCLGSTTEILEVFSPPREDLLSLK